MSASSIYLSWKLEKSITASSMHFLVILLCCFLMVLGLKIALRRSHVVYDFAHSCCFFQQ